MHILYTAQILVITVDNPSVEEIKKRVMLTSPKSPAIWG